MYRIHEWGRHAPRDRDDRVVLTNYRERPSSADQVTFVLGGRMEEGAVCVNLSLGDHATLWADNPFP